MNEILTRFTVKVSAPHFVAQDYWPDGLEFPDAPVKETRVQAPHTSMLHQTRVSGQIDDNFLLRLVNAIEEACDPDDGTPVAHHIESRIDGDSFIAYMEVRDMFTESYPDWYQEETR